MGTSTTRIYSACVDCRRRKVKCNGAEPACSNCIKRGHECVYKNRSKFRNRARQSDLARLNREVELLKAELLIKDPLSYPLGDFSSSSNSSPGFQNGHTSESSESISSKESPSSSKEFEGLSLDVSETNSQVYFMIKNRHKSLVNDKRFKDAFKDISLIEFHNLLELYWMYENVHIMVIWKRIFLSDLLSAEGGLYFSKSLILSVLACGSVFSKSKKLATKGKMLAAAAKSFYRKEEVWEPKITTPQTLCLLSMFEHCKGELEDELYFSNAAINVALELGLNQEVDSNLFAELEDEKSFKRFLWWSVYQIDMLVASAYRRAPIIRKEITKVNPPQVSPLKYLSGLPEKKKESYFEFVFLTTISLELFIIVGHTIRVCYGNLPSISTDERAAVVNKTMGELWLFWQNAQKHLGETEQQHTSPQVLVFKIRYYGAVLRVCGFFIQPQMDPPNPEDLKAIRLCLRVTKKMLYTLKQYNELFGIHTLEPFTLQSIIMGLSMVLCGMSFNIDNRKDELHNDFLEFESLLLSSSSGERYLKNVKTAKLLATAWNVDFL